MKAGKKPKAKVKAKAKAAAGTGSASSAGPDADEPPPLAPRLTRLVEAARDEGKKQGFKKTVTPRGGWPEDAVHEHEDMPFPGFDDAELRRLVEAEIAETGKDPTFPIAIDETGIAQGVLGQVDLNRVTVRDLQDIPGIGAKIANNIIEFRQGLPGPGFKSVTQLKRVPGIGQSKFEQIRHYFKLS